MKFLYHATDTRNEPSIRSVGLIASARSQWGEKYTDYRVYFTQELRDARLIAAQMFDLKESLESISVFKFNAEPLNVKFFIDKEWGTLTPRDMPAIYTDSDIPASAIVGEPIRYTRDICGTPFDRWVQTILPASMS